MRATKILRYLRLVFILLIDILIFLKVLKNTLSSVKLNNKIQESNYFIYELQIRIRSLVEFFCDKLRFMKTTFL